MATEHVITTSAISLSNSSSGFQPCAYSSGSSPSPMTFVYHYHHNKILTPVPLPPKTRQQQDILISTACPIFPVAINPAGQSDMEEEKEISEPIIGFGSRRDSCLAQICTTQSVPVRPTVALPTLNLTTWHIFELCLLDIHATWSIFKSANPSVLLTDVKLSGRKFPIWERS